MWKYNIFTSQNEEYDKADEIQNQINDIFKKNEQRQHQFLKTKGRINNQFFKKLMAEKHNNGQQKKP